MFFRLFSCSRSRTFRRFLNLQEYQCKNILAENGLEIQRFGVADTPETALQVAKKLDAKEYVVKAQILAGGRGKGVFNTGYKGGVHLTKSQEEVYDIAKQMLGNNLITKQTSPSGVNVKQVTVSEALDIVKETYVAVLLDPTAGSPVIIGSPCGGMDIEEVASSSPGKIFKEVIDISVGPTMEQCLRMAKNLDFSSQYLEEAAVQIKNLYDLMVKVDAIQVEINPFAVASNDRVVCFDSKINFDDNARFRQNEIFKMDYRAEVPEVEVKAVDAGLTYIQLAGDIGCLVNGAGLAMATLDIVKLYGGDPSNFLDLGGTANEERVYTALKIFADDKRVSKILVNVFGGIIDCRLVSDGVLNAKRRLPHLQPVVIRLKGTNFDLAKQKVAEFSDPHITLVDDLETAAKTVCSLKV